MITDNNKPLSHPQKAEETIKHKIVDLRVPSPVLSVYPAGIPDNDNDNNESDLLRKELESHIGELQSALDKANKTLALYNSSAAGFFSITCDGVIEHLNKTAAIMLGEVHLSGETYNIREYLSTGSLAAFEDFLHKIFYTGMQQRCELTLNPQGIMGNPIYVTVDGRASSKDKCLLTVVKINKQKDAADTPPVKEQDYDEESVIASQARYRKLFESAKDGIAILDAKNGNILEINPYFSYLLGYTANEILDKPLWEIGIFKNTADAEAIINELREAGYIRYDNILLSTINGKPVYVEFTCNTYMVHRKKVVQCNIRNITERIKAEKEIHTLRKAVEQGPSSIIITNAEGKIEFVNNKFSELTQYQPSEVMGKNPRIFNEGHLSSKLYMELWETLMSGKIWEGKVMNRRKDGTYFWEETTISAVRNLEGDISNYILIQNDISEKQQIINDLILAKEKAIEGDLLKSAFLANMSHEIRTPLNSIIGFSELMKDEDFDQDQLLYFANIINNSGNKLLSIINDIMDLSRIEAGEIKVDKRKISVNQLITNIQKEFLFKAVEKGLDIKIAPFTATEELFIESDENKLRQILINFVSNAIKFTEKGSIEIGMEKENGFVNIRVTDTGIGVPDHYKEQIFERFRQVENAYTKRYGGNGLGLAISKALVDLLGGKIGMETEQGKGSTFYFMIPLA